MIPASAFRSADRFAVAARPSRQADARISRRHGGSRAWGYGYLLSGSVIKTDGRRYLASIVSRHRGTTFWFHISLDLNPNAITDGFDTHCLAGKKLAYIEANTTAAQSTMELLATTPLEVVYSPTLSALPDAHYDILLAGIPVSMRDLSNQREKLVRACSLSDTLVLGLPCHAQVSAEELKRNGVTACLLKPLTSTRLFPGADGLLPRAAAGATALYR